VSLFGVIVVDGIKDDECCFAEGVVEDDKSFGVGGLSKMDCKVSGFVKPWNQGRFTKSTTIGRFKSGSGRTAANWNDKGSCVVDGDDEDVDITADGTEIEGVEADPSWVDVKDTVEEVDVIEEIDDVVDDVSDLGDWICGSDVSGG